ncbi:MAG: phosphopentomutase [Ruminococcaceae bacterium]|nr:phosphopentomutase [Oscillospiraceae bacterium]
MKRVFLIVLDSVGAGALPDAKKFGDSADVNTIKRISASEKFNCPNLKKLGLFNIEGLEDIGKIDKPLAAAFKMAERSMGKDTTTGHWEIAGLVSERPMPTYPNGFPKEILDEFSKKTGRGVLCNKPYSGTQVISDYGDEHIKSGDLIVYTSADSVFQIAAHEDVVPIEKLYEYCEIAREILKGEHAVGRVIARPFVTENGEFKRTANRRDFSLLPPKDTLLDLVKKEGKSVIAVGKISDIFAGKGVTEKIATHSNSEGMEKTLEIAGRDFEGLCFVNLVDFDMLYGHRQDIDGYAAALSEFDAWLPSFLEKMTSDDILLITADHGCDPGDEHTDHTREYTPLLVCSEAVKGGYFGKREGFCDIAASICELLGIEQKCEGESFIQIIRRD